MGWERRRREEGNVWVFFRCADLATLSFTHTQDTALLTATDDAWRVDEYNITNIVKVKETKLLRKVHQLHINSFRFVFLVVSNTFKAQFYPCLVQRHKKYI